MIAGVFFDGERSKSQPARLELIPPTRVRLTIASEMSADGEVEGVSRHWELELGEVEISERIGNIPRRVTLPGIGVFETRDNEAIERALSMLGRSAHLVDRLERRWPIAIAALVAIAVGSALFVRFGVPAIADLAARTLPASVDRVIGTRTLDLLDDRLLHPTKLPVERHEELRGRFAAMTAELGDGHDDYRLELRSAPALGPNALALPSGIVVMTDELALLAVDDDELVAVLAHEIGHVRGRHALRRLFQSASVSALAFALVGDVSSASALFGAVPALIDAKHSRDFEREADAFAKSWLTRHAIDPARFDQILCRMQRGSEGDAGSSWARYLSSHPTTDERARCEAAAVPDEARGLHRTGTADEVPGDEPDEAASPLNDSASPRPEPPPSPAAPGS
jgi:Zn-dependent protease with chaperone function